MSSKPGQPALVVATCGLFGFFSFALMPVCLEVGVECTYPVAEATSAGLLWMAGYIGGFFVVVTYYGNCEEELPKKPVGRQVLPSQPSQSSAHQTKFT